MDTTARTSTSSGTRVTRSIRIGGGPWPPAQLPPEEARRQRGGVLVEFSVSVIVLWLLLAATLDLGRAFAASQLLQTAARAAAREMSLDDGPSWDDGFRDGARRGLRPELPRRRCRVPAGHAARWLRLRKLRRRAARRAARARWALAESDVEEPDGVRTRHGARRRPGADPLPRRAPRRGHQRTRATASAASRSAFRSSTKRTAPSSSSRWSRKSSPTTTPLPAPARARWGSGSTTPTRLRRSATGASSVARSAPATSSTLPAMRTPRPLRAR